MKLRAKIFAEESKHIYYLLDVRVWSGPLSR